MSNTNSEIVSNSNQDELGANNNRKSAHHLKNNRQNFNNRNQYNNNKRYDNNTDEYYEENNEVYHTNYRPIHKNTNQRPVMQRSYQKIRAANRNNMNNNFENIEENHLNDLSYKMNQNKPKQSSKNDDHRKESRSPDENLAKGSSRRKLLSMSSNAGSINCICCLHELYTFVYYACLHYVCLNCAVKMRVLCEKTDCPVCRQDSKEVYCSKSEFEYKSIEEVIKKCPKPPPLMEKTNSGIYFKDQIIRDELNDILSNKCDMCPDGSSFSSFNELDTHMRKSHRRFYCELCLEHLKLFPYERKHYNREELAFHKRNGDKDDLSFKGHPRCEYCDQRFFDRDELYRHFRREHYYCHFCDTDGHEEYYKDYAQLRVHFLKAHYLCELDSCSSNAAQTHEYVVFRTDLDFQAHKKQKHAKTKSDAKSLSKLNIEFSYNDSNRERYSAQHRHKRGYGRGNAAASNNSDNEEFNDSEISQMRKTTPQSKLQTTDIDPAVLRLSQEQFERDEQERKRKAHIERMKEQFKNYEQATGQSTLEEEQGPSKPAKKEEVEEFPLPQAQPQQSNWRNIIGSANVPKLNKEIDFPTLGNSDNSSNQPLSLAVLGATISGQKTLTNAWIKPSVQQTKIEVFKSNKDTSKLDSTIKIAKNEFLNSLDSKPTTSIPESFVKLEGKKSQLSDEELSENKVAGKKNKKNKKKNQLQETIKTTENKELSVVVSEKNDAIQPPPGFSNATTNTIISKAKPLNEPPPGFSKFETNSSEKDDLKKLIDKTSNITSNNNTVDEFIKPDNYDERNQELTNNLFLLFGHYNQKEFEKFKATSIEFRMGNTNAKDYLIACQKLLDLPDKPDAYTNKKNQENRSLHLKFLELVQEMIVLLPHVKKQAELHDAYLDVIEMYNFNLAQGSGSNWIDKTKSSKSQTASNTILNKVKKCNFCDQFFLNTEYNFHQSNEHMKQLNELANMMKMLETSSLNNDNEFPSLSSKPATAQAKWNTVKKEAAVKVDDFPTLNSNSPQAQAKWETAIQKDSNININEDFPSLSSFLPIPPSENRFSALPTPSLFSNPSSHLSLVNKKKHRLQK